MITSAVFGMPVIIAGQYQSRVNTKDGYNIMEVEGGLIITKGDSVTKVFTTNIVCCIMDSLPIKEKKNVRQ